ncbi:MAG TPA: hypothetical protein VMB05_11630 [Solirubrobacteraceae bacterium]|nr:hypothetical protein [Solirubrobacteraceae bacterium]HUB75286.1 hypothetical protein [Solirubrobacteraceae bacterium]
MRERPARGLDELREVSKHLLYEMQMFGMTMTMLAAFEGIDPEDARATMQNALMESWALHARNLLAFLYDDRPARDDAIAGDFIQGWREKRGPKAALLGLAQAKTSKEMAHLSYVRAQLTEDERQWHHAPMIVELGKPLHLFVDEVSEGVVTEGFHERARGALPLRDATLDLHGLEVVAGATQSLMAYGGGGIQSRPDPSDD